MKYFGVQTVCLQSIYIDTTIRRMHTRHFCISMQSEQTYSRANSNQSKFVHYVVLYQKYMHVLQNKIVWDALSSGMQLAVHFSLIKRKYKEQNHSSGKA